MNSIYFVFSDEAGNYKKNPGRKFIKKNPYYIRSAYIVKAIDWRALRDEFLEIKEHFGLDLYDEIKWSETWVAFRRGEINKEEYKNKVKFFKAAMNLLKEISYCKILFTITFNEVVNSIEESNIKKWHIQDIMQRIQYEIQSDVDNLSIIFLDPPSSERERQMFLEIYREIFLNDRFVEGYKNLKDTLNFELSHHSVGIQIADYLAGCFNGFMRGFPESIKIFKEIVYPMIRKNQHNNPLGWGLIEIPSDRDLREGIKNKLEEIGIEIHEGDQA